MHLHCAGAVYIYDNLLTDSNIFKQHSWCVPCLIHSQLVTHQASPGEFVDKVASTGSSPGQAWAKSGLWDQFCFNFKNARSWNMVNWTNRLKARLSWLRIYRSIIWGDLRCKECFKENVTLHLRWNLFDWPILHFSWIGCLFSPGSSWFVDCCCYYSHCQDCYDCFCGQRLTWLVTSDDLVGSLCTCQHSNAATATGGPGHPECAFSSNPSACRISRRSSVRGLEQCEWLAVFS